MGSLFGGRFSIRKPPKMGFLDPRNTEIPNARTKSGEFLGPKLSTPTILPIRAKTWFWGGFFGPPFLIKKPQKGLHSLLDFD
jgi:hypothetical protein